MCRKCDKRPNHGLTVPGNCRNVVALNPVTSAPVALSFRRANTFISFIVYRSSAMRTSLRFGVLMILFTTSLLVAQNNRVYLEIEPNSPDPNLPFIVDYGMTVRFTARAYEIVDPTNPPVQVLLTNVHWIVDPINFGTITQDGLYAAPGIAQPSSITKGMVIVSGEANGQPLKGYVLIHLGTPPPPLQYDWTITGTVTGDAGLPLVGASVVVDDVSRPNTSVLRGLTDTQGVYAIKVPQGSWTVSANMPGYVIEYYDNATTPNQATKLVTDSANKTIAGIDFSLGHGGSISGRVTESAGGKPLVQANVNVTVHQGNGPSILPIFGALTDHNGEYTVAGLPTGTYIAQAVAKGYELQYFDGKTDPLAADTIAVSSGGAVSNIDFILDQHIVVPVNPYRITGTVRDAAGTPIAHALIVAENPLTMPPNTRTMVTKSAPDGSYTLQVPGGKFIVRAEAQGYLDEYYDNVRSANLATMLTLGPQDTMRAGVDFSLGTGGTITGVVLQASDNAPVAGAWVTVVSPVNSKPPANGVMTDSAGVYRIPGLNTGTYIVMASKDGFATQYFDQVSDPSLATDVSVIDGQTTAAIDFALSVPPSISGTVKDGSGNPLAFAEVHAQSIPLTPTQPMYLFATKTDVNGEYTIVAPPGTYILQAMAQGYMPMWYDQIRQADSATRIVLGTANVTGIDFTLNTGGIISGTVRMTGGAAVRGARVSIFFDKTTNPPFPNNTVNGVVTGDNGAYAIPGLVTGKYIVVAQKDGFVLQFYSMASDLTQAKKVDVTEGLTTTGIDFELGTLPGVSGTVSDQASGLPIPKAEVWVSSSSQRFVTYTDLNGEFHIGVAPGTYKMNANAPGYSSEWYNEQADAANANDVHVAPGGTVSNINFTLARWGGGISGTVTDAANAPIEKAVVKVWAAPDSIKPPANVRPFFASTSTASDGSYSLQGMPPGEYIVATGGGKYLLEFYQDAPDIRTATRVSVLNTQTSSGIDFTLEPGGSIRGTVTDAATNAPIPYAFVSTRGTTTSSLERGARADKNGVYTIDGLAGGDYTLFAVAGKYVGEYYDGVTDPALATPVTVTAPAATTGIDFALATAPHHPVKYAGVVRDAVNGQPLALTLIEAINPLNGAAFVTTTDIGGAYDFTADAQCLVRARAIGYIGLCAGGTQNWEEGAKNASNGVATFSLPQESENGFAMLYGRVLDKQTRKAVPNAWVYGTDTYGNQFFEVTDARGQFAMDGLGNGTVNIVMSGVQYAETQGSVTIPGASGNTEINARRNDATLPVDKPAAPSKLVLAQNFPNPFGAGSPSASASTSIAFSLPSAGTVTIRVFNLIGRQVATLVDGDREAGNHTVAWNASAFPAGVYIYRIEANGAVLTRRMALLK